MSQRWQRKKERANHADDWLMTYADMITLLLCFFAIFLSVELPKKDTPHKVEIPKPVEQVEQIVQPAKPPELFEGNLPFHGIPISELPADESDDPIPAPAANPPPPMPASAPLPAVIDPPKPQEAVSAIVDQAPASLPPAEAQVVTPAQTPVTIAAPPVVQTPSAPAEDTSAALREIVDRLLTKGTADFEQKGDRITTIQVSSAAFFASGSATLSPSGESILREVASNLKTEQFRDYQITVEGHTDDQPIDTPQFPSNWELSTARASAVVHFFLGQGLPPQKLRAAGYADTFPLVPNRDANGNPIPENQAQNRRVVIKLEKIVKTEAQAEQPEINDKP